MNGLDSDSDSARLQILLHTLASQAETIRLQALTIHRLTVPVDEEGEGGDAAHYLDGAPVRR